MLQYRIPKNISLGSGKVRRLQEKLVSKFERLESQTNTYLDAESRSVQYDIEAFKETLDESKGCIKVTRDATVQLMANIYYLGQEPLPSKKGVDEDVSTILMIVV